MTVVAGMIRKAVCRRSDDPSRPFRPDGTGGLPAGHLGNNVSARPSPPFIAPPPIHRFVRIMAGGNERGVNGGHGNIHVPGGFHRAPVMV